MMRTRYGRILIIADIEGSSGWRDYRASSFLTREWAMACEAMTRDINSIDPRLLSFSGRGKYAVDQSDGL